MTEWVARLSRGGDKILCGRSTGNGRHDCDGLIANVQHNLAGRTWISLPRGAVEIEPGVYGLSPRAAARLASGRPVTGRTPWQRGAKLLPVIALTVVPPFRWQACPACRTVALVPADVLAPVSPDVLG